MSYDVPVNKCPICGVVYPEGVEFVYLNPPDEWVCADCAEEMT